MTPQEAKQILATYRPGAADAHEPQFAEALALARQDAELKRWLEENHAVQTALRARFKQITPPAGLKQQIISEHNHARVIVAWWRRPATLAVAALIILLGSVAVFWTLRDAADSRQMSFTTYRTRMISAAVRSYPMSLETADASQVRSHLASKGAAHDYTLPAALEQTPLAGCGTLSWKNNQVAMVCFLSGEPLASGEKSDLFLFVVNRADVPGAPASASPMIARIRKLTTAAWSVGDKTYLLATPGDEAVLRKFL